MESIPFIHRDQAFTIVFEDDLAFTEVRAILDHLLDNDAFNCETQESRLRYIIAVEEQSFDVWVYESEVIVQRV
jgi:hypothetical protein